MTGTLEFTYRHKSKVVFGFLAFFAVCLAAVAGLAYFFFTGNLSGSDFRGQRGGKLLIAIPFAIAIVVLIPIYLIRAQRGALRVTDSELTAGTKMLPIREIRQIDIREVDKLRTMYVRTSNPKLWLMINESMLPSAESFNQVQQAVLSSRTDWLNKGTVWSAR